MKTIKKILSAAAGASASMLLSASRAWAEIENPVLKGDLTTDSVQATSGTSFETYFLNLWQAALGLGAVAVLILFIWGAFEWIVSGGDKGKVENARNRITNAVIGLIILVGTFTILGFMGQLFFGDGFNILEISLPNSL